MSNTMYGSHAIRVFQIEQPIYNYLLPVYGICADNKVNSYPMVSSMADKYFFYGTIYDHKEMLNRISFFK